MNAEEVPVSKVSKRCNDCFNLCRSLNECLRLQEFNLVVEQANAISKLKRVIQCTPTYKGSQKFFEKPPNNVFREREFSESTQYYTRFMTITFDPKKFTFNQLTQPELLKNYVFNAIYNLYKLFKGNIRLIFEYHKSGILHTHLNYEAWDIHCHAHILLRLRYYFSKTLKNKSCIHDRIFNDGGIKYLQKSNKTYYEFNWYAVNQGPYPDAPLPKQTEIKNL